MPFREPITDGEDKLIQDAIKSENYVPGESGWAINKTGFAEFLNVVIRAVLQSDNFVAGVSGWRLDPDGDAELNDATIRGDLQSSNYVAGTAGWKLSKTGLAELAEVLINSFGASGRVTINNGRLQIYNLAGELALSAGVDAAAPFFGPYFALYDTSTGVPRFIIAISSPSTYPIVRLVDASGVGYLELDPGTGFGSALRSQPVASGATVQPALFTTTESNPGEVLLELWSPENTQHAAGIRSLIQLYSGYQFRQSSKIEHHASRSEFFGDIVSSSMRRVSAFSATSHAVTNTAHGTVSAPPLEVTLQARASGCIDVHIATRGSNSSAGVPLFTSFIVRENNALGAILRTASDIDLQHQDCNGSRFGVTVPLSGLPAFSGSVTDYWVAMTHRVPSGTGTVSDRRLIVSPQW